MCVWAVRERPGGGAPHLIEAAGDQQGPGGRGGAAHHAVGGGRQEAGARDLLGVQKRLYKGCVGAIKGLYRG